MYQICKRCLMDSTDNHISFDIYGICNHCHGYDKVVKTHIIEEKERENLFLQIVEKIKLSGKNKKYDCITGLSGGADSSYVVYIAKKYGLRPLIVHLDNGWDDIIAVKNVQNILKKTGFDIVELKIDKSEFVDIQRAYLEASVVDVEVPTDMAINSVIHQMALKYNVRYVLSGVNYETEYTMGKDWNFSKTDRSNFESIYNKYGTQKLKTFPYYSPFQQFLYRAKGIKTINILQYTTCNYKVIKSTLKSEFDWKDYYVKHGESEFTKFYQSYYLPKKFGIDKRRAHLSDQIRAGIIQRSEAVELMNISPYQSEKDEMENRNKIIKELGYTANEFERIINTPNRSHRDFAVGEPYGNLVDRFFLKLLNSRIIMGGFRRLYRCFK